MKNWKPSVANSDQLFELRRLVLEGENQFLEFKHKIAHPEKIVREMVAFANSDGGTLLIGIDDDGRLTGVKYPDEELLTLHEALSKYVRTKFVFHDSIIEISHNKYILRLDIPPSDKKPIYFFVDHKTKESFIRVNDQTIKASAQMIEIIRRKKKPKNIRFYFTEHELALMQFLDSHAAITIQEFQKITGLNRFAVSRKLILLVLANVLKITATEKGDFYSRV